MKFNDFFDNVYVINLTKRLDRFNDVTAEMWNNNIKFERFEAIDGDLLEGEYELKKGVVGCKMSHNNVFYDVVKNKYKKVAIFEDDVVLHDDFNDLFLECYNELPRNWDFVYLGGNNYMPTIKVSEHIEKTTCTYALHGYLIKYETAVKFVEAIENGEFKSRIDAEIDRFLHRNNMNVYIFNPKIAFQRAGYSDNLKKMVNYDNILNNKN